MGLAAFPFDSMIRFILCDSEEVEMTTCRNEEMRCIGVIDKLPVVSGDGETVVVNGLNGFVFHHVEVGSKAWAKFDGRGEASTRTICADGGSLWRLFVMELVRIGGAG